MKTENILEFSENNRFLSNFYKSLFRIDNKLYLSVEHWYQANKTTNPIQYEHIRNCNKASEAKRIGNEIDLRPDWNDIKLDIMHRGVYTKFTQNETLRKKLLDTGDALLVEGNTWGDQYWGVCNGVGENHLGKILMRVREELRSLP